MAKINFSVLMSHLEYFSYFVTKKINKNYIFQNSSIQISSNSFERLKLPLLGGCSFKPQITGCLQNKIVWRVSGHFSNLDGIIYIRLAHLTMRWKTPYILTTQLVERKWKRRNCTKDKTYLDNICKILIHPQRWKCPLIFDALNLRLETWPQEKIYI